jgi:hypothetical protein
MARQYLRGRTNLLLGSIEETANDKVGYDARNLRVGRYDKRSNKTYDASNRLIGSGDQLSSLITKAGS